MIVTAIALAFALSANKPDLDLSTFGILCRDLVASTPYKLEIPKDLDTRPIVYHFEGKAEPMARLKGLCKNLFLTCAVDEDAKTVVVSRAMVASNRRTRLQNGLNNLARFLGQYNNWTTDEIAQEVDRLFKRGEELTNDPDAMAKLFWEQRILHESATTVQRFLERMLLSGLTSRTAGVIAKPCSSTNRLGVVFNDNELEEIIEYGRSRREALLGTGDIGPQPIAVVRHSEVIAGEVSLSLVLVTPNVVRYVGYCKLPCGLQALTVPAQGDSVNLALQPKKPYSALRMNDKVWTGLDFPSSLDAEQDPNGLGGLAIDLKCNYAGWFDAKFRGRGYLNRPISKVVESSAVRLSVADGWLQIVDYDDPIPEYAGSWEPFVKLKACAEDAPLSQRDLLKKLDQLSDKDLKDLELFPTAAMTWASRYYEGLTYGVRILRAVLRESKALGREPAVDFDLPIAALGENAKADAFAFLKGEWVWQALPNLMHPLNASRLGRIHLRAKTVEEEDRVVIKFGLTFPEGSVSLGNGSAPSFELVLAK